MKRKLLDEENKFKIAEIESDMYFNRVKQKADGDYFTDLKELETIEGKLSDKWLKLQAIEAIATNSKFYIGSKIP